VIRRADENIALYRRFGLAETGRGSAAGYDRVFIRAPLNMA
jgi:hypothetical protein